MQDFTYNFFLKVQVTDGCWLWKGLVNSGGYGLYTKHKGMRTKLAHRISYVIFNGEFDDNLHVCHHCDNPRCVNPNHLFLGTDLDNQRDKWRKGRGNTPFKVSDYCKKGHLFTEEITYIKTNGKRICKICDNDRRQVIRKKLGKFKIFNGYKTHCHKGHEFTKENTRIEKPTGGRRCITCRNERDKQKRLVRKQQGE